MNNLTWKGKPLFTEAELDAFRKALCSLNDNWLDELGYVFRRELSLREKKNIIASPRKISSHKQLEKFTNALEALNREVKHLQGNKAALYPMISESYETWKAFSAVRDILRKNSNILVWHATQASSKILQHRNPKGGRPKGSVSDANAAFIENLLRYFLKYKVKTSKQGHFMNTCDSTFKRITGSRLSGQSGEAFEQTIKRIKRRIKANPENPAYLLTSSKGSQNPC